jgi:hypothetical protein
MLTGKFANARVQLELYLNKAKSTDKNYQDALIALNRLDQGEKKASEQRAIDVKVDAAWENFWVGDYFSRPASGKNNCPILIDKIKSVSKSARKFSCACESRQNQHPAYRDVSQDECKATFQVNPLLDNKETSYDVTENGPRDGPRGLSTWYFSIHGR